MLVLVQIGSIRIRLIQIILVMEHTGAAFVIDNIEAEALLGIATQTLQSSPSAWNTMIDPKAPTYGRVNTQGQIDVRFHCNTKRLKYFFEKAQLDSIYHPAKCPKARKGSTTFVNEKSKSFATPRLSIAIHICGSRGDVQPFIPIAKLLQAPPYEHRVRICTHPAFKDFVVGVTTVLHLPVHVN